MALFGMVFPTVPVTLLVAGDSAVWTFFDPAHKASDGWAAQFVLMRGGSQILIHVMTADVDNFSVALLSGDTAALTTGVTQAYIIFTKATTRETEFFGNISIAPNPIGTFTPTPEMVALTGVKDAITKIVSQPEASASFNGQTYTMQNLKDLFDARDRLQATVNGQFRAMGITVPGTFKTILTRFK